MNRELLEQPFSQNQIKQRPGTFGKQLNFIEGHDVIKRLNDAFDGNWNFRIVEHHLFDDEIVVLGELVAENISKSQFGSSAITKARDTGVVVSLGDDFKAATTDALKKAASLFGVGLHLYSKDSGTASQNRREDSNNTYSGTNHTSTNGQSTTYHDTAPANTNPPNNSNGRISSKQHSYLISLAQDRGLSKQDLNRQSLEHYGSALAYLTKHQASEMIKSMQH